MVIVMVIVVFMVTGGGSDGKRTHPLLERRG